MKNTNLYKTEKELQKNLIATVSEQCSRLYQEIKTERTRLFKEEDCQSNEDFSIFGEIEIFSDSVEGVASQIIDQGQHRDPIEAITALRKYDIFKFPEFTQWFFTSVKEYPGYCRFVLVTDYLRRLVIEYIKQYQLSKPDR